MQSELFNFLTSNNILYKQFEHPPIFTCEEAQTLAKDIPGFATKNLFLLPKNSDAPLLVTLPEYKRLSIREFTNFLKLPKLSFAKEELLKEHLHVEPGSVTMMGLIFDHSKKIKVYIDKAVWEAGEVQCHPLINTATLVIQKDGLRKFFEATGHVPVVIDLPVVR